MRAEGLNHYPYILGMALVQDRIDTEVTICILSQSRHQKISFRLSWGVRNRDRLNGLTTLDKYRIYITILFNR